MPAVLLSLDPGTNNFAYCVSRVHEKRDTPFTVLQHGMLFNTVRTLTNASDLAGQYRQYLSDVVGLINKHRVTHIIAERYMLRRGQGGTAIESINMMLGALLSLSLPVKVIPASQWKNDAARRGVDLESLYAQVSEFKITPHQLDATHIGAYAAGLLLNADPPYDGLSEQVSRLPSCNFGVKYKPPKKVKKRRRLK